MKKYNKTKNKLPKKGLGGLFQNLKEDINDFDLKKAGELAGNYGRIMADNTLSTIGLSNVIQDTDYKGSSANDFKNISNVMGTIGKTILPTVANIAVPGSGQIIKAGQNALGNFNPQQEMADGGIANANVELEKEEVFMLPNGIIDQVDGPSHEQGGVEVNLPDQSKILSDRLKFNGKTFASLGKKYKTNKDEKILKESSLKNSRTSAELNMKAKNKVTDMLFNVQERKKMLSDKSNNSKKFPNGGLYNVPNVNDVPYNNNYYVDPNDIYSPQSIDFMSEVDNMNLGVPTVNGRLPNNQNNMLEPLPSRDANQINTTFNAPTINENITASDTPYNQSMSSKLKEYYNNNKTQINKGLGEAGQFGLQNVGNLAYLINQGKRFDNVDYGSVNPSYLTNEQNIREIKDGYNTSLYNLKNSGRMTQSGQVALSNSKMRQIADSNERINNVNTQIDNNFKQYNQGLKMQSMNDTAQNKGQALTNYYKAIGAIGQNSALQRRDYLTKQMDENKLKLINQTFPNYKFDPTNFEFLYQQALNNI